MNLEENQDSSLADIQQTPNIITDAKPDDLAEAVSGELINNDSPENLEETKNSDITDKAVSYSDQKLYDEVLEKLDIVKNKKQVTQEMSMPKNEDLQALDNAAKKEKSLQQVQLENSVAQDFIKIQKMMSTGLIDSMQGQKLKNQVLNKAFDKLSQIENINNISNEASIGKNIIDKNQVFEEFSRDNPKFFETEGRKEVLDYLKSDGIFVEKDELDRISNLIRTVEKSAIDKYLKEITHDKVLKDSNDVAKQKLTAHAQKSNFSNQVLKTFSRAQIGKMSSAEFTKYEPIIMEQLKKGLIK